MSENKVLREMGYFPDQIEGEEIVKLPYHYKAGDKGRVKALIEIERTVMANVIPFYGWYK